MGSSVMWSCSFYYIMQLSQKHAEEKKQDIEKVTGEFFGKFTAISHVSILVGTIFMSVVFESVGIHHDHSEQIAGNTDGNYTFTTEPSEFNATEVEIGMAEPECGLYYKFADTEVKHEKGVDDLVMYVLLSAYLACNLVAAFLCLCLDEVTGSETKVAEEAVGVSMLSINSNGLDLCKNHDVISQQEEKEEGEEEEELSSNNVANTSDRTSSFQLIKSTLKVLATDKAAWLLIPFTLHYGMIQGFARGVYNASWVTCALG